MFELVKLARAVIELGAVKGGAGWAGCGRFPPPSGTPRPSASRYSTAGLSKVQRRLDSGAVSVARGGKNLLRKRSNLAAAGLTEDQWRQQWEAARLFLTADGEAGKAWGNETIRFHPDEGWLELKLPAPLAPLANRPHGRYRLSCPVAFSYRGDEVAAQAATGAVRYDITLDPASARWYLDALAGIPTGKRRGRLVRSPLTRACWSSSLIPLTARGGGRALARPSARAPPEGDRAPRGSAGARATRARPPGRAPREREPRRPGGRGTASPGAAPAIAGTRPAPRKPATPRGPRQPPGTKTGPTGPRRATRRPKTARDRRAPQDYLLHARLGTVLHASWPAHLGVTDGDGEAEGPENLASCRHYPGRAYNWCDGDHDALDVRGGQPSTLYSGGVGHVGGRRGVHCDQGRQPCEHEIARRNGIVVNRGGRDVHEGVEDGRVGLTDPPAISAERASRCPMAKAMA